MHKSLFTYRDKNAPKNESRQFVAEPFSFKINLTKIIHSSVKAMCKTRVNKLIILLIISFQFNVSAAISITEIQPLKYPSAIKNGSKSTVVVVNWKGKLGKATNTTLLDNDYHQGRYLITSDSTAPISIDFFQLGNEYRVNLKNLRVRYKNQTLKSFPASGLANPGLDGEYIDIGAKVVAGKNATSGMKSPQYTLRIEEQ
ncbi:hypothetical protein [Shewanella woodyi]|uniref:hypothetical protein n=1 Tax=Shewanella woodyi TaxID=60961 RepID=UPI003748B148